MSVAAATSASRPPKIRIGPALGRAYGSLFTHPGPFAKIVAVPLALYTLLPVATIPVYPSIKSAIGNTVGYETAIFMDSAGLEDLIDQILLAVPVTLFCGHWLRFLARPGPAAGRRTVLVWTRRDLSVLAYAPLFMTAPVLYFLYRAFEMVLSTYFFDAYVGEIELAVKYGDWIFYLEFWGSLIFIVVALAFLIARFGPALAATSTGTRLGLRGAWRLARGQTLRLMVLWLILGHATSTVGYLIQTRINAAYSEALDAGFDPSFGLVPTNNEIGWEAVWQVVQIPQSVLHFIGPALAMTVFLQVFRGDARGDADAPQDILERFE